MPSIEADILLAQSAQYSAEGGISALGIGWQVRSPEPVPWAVMVVLRGSRDLIGSTHAAVVILERASGVPVTDNAGNPLTIDFEFAPDGIPSEAGLITPILGTFCFNLPPLPLEPATEFFFRLRVDGETREHWVAPFRTTPP